MNVAAILKLKGRTVVTTTADKSLLEVAKLLVQHGIGCIVIEGDDGKVAGIVSERDLMRAIGQSGAKKCQKLDRDKPRRPASLRLDTVWRTQNQSRDWHPLSRQSALRAPL